MECLYEELKVGDDVFKNIKLLQSSVRKIYDYRWWMRLSLICFFLVEYILVLVKV